MAIEVVMPQMGQSVAEGTVLEWFKREGERVEKDEALLTINTDKIDVEIPSPGAGTLSRILVQAGETVPVGTALATIEGPEPDRPPAGTTPSAPTPESLRSREETSRWYSPAVLELAERQGLGPSELQEIRGTGQSGRVTKQDILNYLAERDAGTAPRVDDEVVPFTPMRRAIAEHMVRSKQTAPHATAIIEVDMTTIAEFREREKATSAERRGAPLTFLPFVIQAAVQALTKHPWLNAWVEHDRIVLKREINIGIAVALQDGLIVPVLKGAGNLSLAEIARQADDLARRAREKRLTPMEVQGGTFTVNNLGVSGILLATPILVQPQAGILGVGAVTRRPIVIGNETAIRSLAYLCLSFDHRVIDGAMAGQFLQEVKARLEGFDPTAQ
ncbi:MAG: 2-oxo acid dehydrogenase subunit E2 [candidate division NC10 bacterium]|nr:2-oxo acid dehydrogenase subunit E2 [candidate division NC10 bacterium]